MAQAIQNLRPSTSKTLQGGLSSGLKTALVWGGVAALAAGGVAALLAATGGISIPWLLGLKISAGTSVAAAFMGGIATVLPWAAGIGGAVGFITGARNTHHQQKIEISQMQQATIDTKLQPGLARQVSFEGPNHPANNKQMEFTEMIAQQRARQGTRSV